MGMRKVLQDRFPQTFAGFEQPKRPLKVGIHDDVIAAAPELPPHLVRWAIRNYASGPTYHKSCTPGAVRIGLDGQPAGEVTDQDAIFHASRFERIMAKRAGAKGAPPA